jgi:hypothetical protein
VDDYGPCHSHGTCNGAGTFGGTGICECHDGWKGHACESCNTTRDPHWLPDCKNCAPGFYGIACQEECTCLLGSCNDGRTGTGECLCSANGYSCIDDGHGRCDNTTGHCTCIATGFFGDQCERSGAGAAAIAAGVLTPSVALFVALAACKSRRGLGDYETKWRSRSLDIDMTKFNMNFPNFFEIILLLVEMLQLCALSFRKIIPWSSQASGVQSFTLPLLFEFDQATEFFIVSVATASVAAMFTLLVLTFYIKCCGVYLFDRLSRSRCGTLLLAPAPTFILVVSILWLPFTSVMFRGLNCTYLTSGGKQPYLDSDTSITCWTSSHMLYIVMSIAGLFVFVPLALDLKPKMSVAFAPKPQQIVYNPHFTLFQLVTELTSTAVTTFLSKYSLIHIILTCLICIILAVYVYTKQPCSFASINTWHTTL